MNAEVHQKHVFQRVHLGIHRRQLHHRGGLAHTAAVACECEGLEDRHPGRRRTTRRSGPVHKTEVHWPTHAAAHPPLPHSPPLAHSFNKGPTRQQVLRRRVRVVGRSSRAESHNRCGLAHWGVGGGGRGGAGRGGGTARRRGRSAGQDGSPCAELLNEALDSCATCLRAARPRARGRASGTALWCDEALVYACTGARARRPRARTRSSAADDAREDRPSRLRADARCAARWAVPPKSHTPYPAALPQRQRASTCCRGRPRRVISADDALSRTGRGGGRAASATRGRCPVEQLHACHVRRGTAAEAASRGDRRSASPSQFSLLGPRPFFLACARGCRCHVTHGARIPIGVASDLRRTARRASVRRRVRRGFCVAPALLHCGALPQSPCGRCLTCAGAA